MFLRNVGHFLNYTALQPSKIVLFILAAVRTSNETIRIEGPHICTNSWNSRNINTARGWNVRCNLLLSQYCHGVKTTDKLQNVYGLQDINNDKELPYIFIISVGLSVKRTAINVVHAV